MNINLNLERLIGAVQEHFDNEQSYALEGKQTYKVIDTKEGGCFGWSVVCKWQDGETNSHSTSLIPGKDFEVVA